MVELDDIIPGKKNQTKEKQPFDKQKWAAEKQQSRKAAYALMDSTAEAICKDSPAFRVYLDVQTRFDRYSIGNALLVTAQKPKATQLKGKNASTVMPDIDEAMKMDNSTKPINIEL